MVVVSTVAQILRHSWTTFVLTAPYNGIFYLSGAVFAVVRVSRILHKFVAILSHSPEISVAENIR